jgi:outer membrane protein OmpA-like peptidoglycan-associated protein
MKYSAVTVIGCALSVSASAQWYYGPPDMSGPSVVIVNQAPARPVVTEVIAQPRRPFLIAFTNKEIWLAQTYWVAGNTLNYVTLDHQLKMAPLSMVDRAFSERLNWEQNIAFSLPHQNTEAERRLALQQSLNAILETRCISSGLITGIPDVFFGLNRYTLTPVARDKLDKIAAILSGFNGLIIRLDGHTDNSGSEVYNVGLSRKRAEAVRRYLVARGVPEYSISVSGFGSASPVASNTTAQGRKQNRRVDMLIAGDAIGTKFIAASGVAARSAK